MPDGGWGREEMHTALGKCPGGCTFSSGVIYRRGHRRALPAPHTEPVYTDSGSCTPPPMWPLKGRERKCQSAVRSKVANMAKEGVLERDSGEWGESFKKRRAPLGRGLCLLLTGTRTVFGTEHV